jgi:hypothetical protein
VSKAIDALTFRPVWRSGEGEDARLARGHSRAMAMLWEIDGPSPKNGSELRLFRHLVVGFYSVAPRAPKPTARGGLLLVTKYNNSDVAQIGNSQRVKPCVMGLLGRRTPALASTLPRPNGSASPPRAGSGAVFY